MKNLCDYDYFFKKICLTSKMEKFLTDGHWYYGL